jgi:hypothetical protein
MPVNFTLTGSNLSVPEVDVTVTDLLGRQVLSQKMEVAGNRISRVLTLPDANGIYLLRLKAGDRIVSRKIVVE